MPQILPVALEREEQSSLIKSLESTTPQGLRNIIMINLILNYGLRLSELRFLQWNYLSFDNNTIYIPESRGGNSRLLQLRVTEHRLLSKWKHIQAEYCNSEFVLTTLSGNIMNGSYIESIIKRHAQRAGISKRISPHLLRHIFAVDSYKKTGDITKVQKLLGHFYISTTKEYLQIIDTRVAPSKLKWLKI